MFRSPPASCSGFITRQQPRRNCGISECPNQPVVLTEYCTGCFSTPAIILKKDGNGMFLNSIILKKDGKKKKNECLQSLRVDLEKTETFPKFS